jgi:branched-chain amino acid transport system substrate-binding protein
MKKYFIVMGVLVLTTMMVPAVDLHAQGTIKIGSILPLTGPLATIGQAQKKGAEFTVDLINKRHNFNTLGAKWEGIPGLGGAKLEIIFADHQGKPEVGMAEAERMINEHKVVAMLGAYMSGVMNTISPVCERRRVPHLTESTATSLSQRGFKYFFRITANAAQGIDPLMDFIEEYYKNNNLKMKGVGLMMEDTASGVDNGKMYVKIAENKGWKVISNVPYSHATMDLTSEVQKVIAADPDVLFQMPYPSDGILQMKTLKKFGWLPKIMLYGGGANDDAKFQEALGKDTDFISERVVWSLDIGKRKPVIAELNEAFKKFSGINMDPNSVRYIAQIQVLADALNRAKSTDPEKLREALEATNISEEDLVIMHGVKFDPKTHDNPIAICLVGQRKDGHTHIVWPDKFATMKFVYPMQSWSKR